jgi:hypothetical protein
LSQTKPGWQKSCPTLFTQHPPNSGFPQPATQKNPPLSAQTSPPEQRYPGQHIAPNPSPQPWQTPFGSCLGIPFNTSPFWLVHTSPFWHPFSSQHFCPDFPHGVHTRLWQINPLSHFVLPQQACPLAPHAEMHVPPWHTSTPLHVRPQAPQLLLSLPFRFVSHPSFD